LSAKWLRISHSISSSFGRFLAQHWLRAHQYQLCACPLPLRYEPTQLQNNLKLDADCTKRKIRAKVLCHWSFFPERLVWWSRSREEIEGERFAKEWAVVSCKWRLGWKWWSSLLLRWCAWPIFYWTSLSIKIRCRR
jgi:hypothetical protein